MNFEISSLPLIKLKIEYKNEVKNAICSSSLAEKLFKNKSNEDIDDIISKLINFIRKKGVKKLGLENIDKILKFKHSKTFSDDNLEGQGLDPWVQWVSIHTGKPSSIHNVLRIGDIPKLEFPPEPKIVKPVRFV